MSKNLRRVVALVVTLSLCVSVFAGLTAQAAFEVSIGSAWPPGISYTHLTDENTTAEQKTATINAVKDELIYQNDVLGFRLGTTDSGTAEHKLEAWDGMLCIQMENRDASKTDNTGSPAGWNDPTRLWCVTTVPFAGTAFTIKHDMARLFDGYGKPALSNQYEYNGRIYQLRWDNTHYLQSGSRSAVAYYPGKVGSSDASYNAFRYAVADFNQKNKRTADDGKAIVSGHPTADARYTSDNTYLYQALEGPSGNSYIVMKRSAIENGVYTGAYVVGGGLTAAFAALGANMEARLAITGAPLGSSVKTANGWQQAFENGLLTVAGFKSGARNIESFTVAGQAAPAKIDHAAGTVEFYLNAGTSATAVTPAITISDGASITPTSAQNFTSPVEYTVTAASGDTRKYTAKVVFLSKADVTSFSIDGNEGTIDYTNKVITIVAPATTNLAAVVPTVTAAGGAAALNPATLNLTNSWTAGTTFTVSNSGVTATYTIKARNKSTDTSVISYKLDEDKLRYTDKKPAWPKYSISGNNINVELEFGNNADTAIAAVLNVNEYSKISPDPSIVVKQNTKQYTVTSENGETKTYTVNVTVDTTDPKFVTKTAAELALTVKDGSQWDRFKNPAVKTDMLSKIVDEYNYWRVRGIDPGKPNAEIEGWGGMLVRQFFTDGYGVGTKNPIGQGTAMITMDVAKGKAFLVAGAGLDAWSGYQPDPDGVKDAIGFDKAGGAASNAFTMEDKTYQQFSMSYAVYTANAGNILLGTGVTKATNGIGAYYKPLEAILKTTQYYNTAESSFFINIRDSFRQAYEDANMYGINPGVALGSGDKANLQYDEASKMLYQVFTGTGGFRSESRDNTKKTIIIKGMQTRKVMVDKVEVDRPFDGAFAIFDGSIKTAYESIPASQYEDMTLGGVSFKYNKTYGTPKRVLTTVANDGTFILWFQTGAKADSNEQCYFTVPKGDVSKMTKTDGSPYSDDNLLNSLTISVEGETTVPEHTLQIFNGDTTINGNAVKNIVRIDFKNASRSQALDYVKKLVIEKYTLNHSAATMRLPAVDEDGKLHLDATYTGQITTVAENDAAREYSVWVWAKDGVEVSDDIPPKEGTVVSQSNPDESGSTAPTSSDPTYIPATDGQWIEVVTEQAQWGYYDQDGNWVQLSDSDAEAMENASTGDAGIAVGVAVLFAVSGLAVIALRRKKK